jgi:HlyD family secretion protein
VAALTAALSAARTRVEVAQSAASSAARDAERAQRLFDAGALSQRALDEAKTGAAAATSDLEAARARVNEVEAERAAAQAALAVSGSAAGSAVTVTASRRGRVLRLFEESPRVLPAGTPLAQIGDISDMEAVIPILSADAPGVRTGAMVRYVLGTRSDTIVGAVKRVEPAAFTKFSALGVEEQRVNVIASVTDTAGRLGAQYRLDARITTWEADVLRVPTAALIRDGAAWTAFVIRDGRARRVRVEVGERSADAAEVRGGLSDGDAVILYPAEAIGDGTRVHARVTAT